MRLSRSKSQSHPFYVRDGKNIRLTLPVTLKEAVLGAKVKVPTPDGAVMVTIPKGSTSGKVLRLKARGFSAKDGRAEINWSSWRSTFRRATRNCASSRSAGPAAATRRASLGV